MTALEKLLRIKPEERNLVLWMVAFFGLVQVSHGLAANTADALFFQRFGVDRLPLMILVSGPGVMFAILAHGAGLSAMEPARWLRILMLGCAAWASIEWVAVAVVETQGAYPLIWISTYAIIMLTYTAMWNAAAAVVTTRQAKRVFPIFATAGIAGGVLGNILTGPLARQLGTPNLLLIQVGLLVAAAVVLLPLGRSFATTTPAPNSVDSMSRRLRDTATTVRSSRLLRLTAVVAAAISCLFFLVYFPFSSQVASSFETEAGTAAFLGRFASIATAVTFVVSLLVTNRLFSRFGIVMSLLLVPLMYAGGFATWTVTLTLVSASIVRGLQWVITNAIGATAFTALFNVVPRSQRSQVTTFMFAVPAQIGTMIGGLVLLVTSGRSWSFLFIIGFVIAVIFLVSVLRVRDAYVESLIESVRSGVPGMFGWAHEGLITPLDADAVNVLLSHLDDPRPEARATALAWLSSLDAISNAGEVERLLSDESAQVRTAAFDTICIIDPDRISDHAITAIHDDVAEIRLHALGYLRASGNTSKAAYEGLSDPDPRVRSVAAVLVGGAEGQAVIDELLSSKDPHAVAAGLLETSSPSSGLEIDPLPFLQHEHPGPRAAAVASAFRRGQPPDQLTPLLNDGSPRVRAATARALATTDDGREALMSTLESGSVLATEAALRALTSLDEPTPRLLDWAAGEVKRAAHLRNASRSLQAAPNSTGMDYLLRILNQRSHRLVGWVLRAMTTPETAHVMPIVSRGIHSDSAEVRSQALEALETLGRRDVTTVLLPLLEQEPEVPSIGRPILESLAGDFDSWVSRLARRVLVEQTSDGVANSQVVDDNVAPLNDPLDRVLVLQRVRMFMELDPEDLDLISRTVSERNYEPGEFVYRFGEPGEEMLIVVTGRAVVSLGSGPNLRVVQSYGPGETVGELSLLTGESRSADVSAGPRGMRCLILTGDALASALEERPTVALGMLETLARRIIEQTRANRYGGGYADEGVASRGALPPVD